MPSSLSRIISQHAAVDRLNVALRLAYDARCAMRAARRTEMSESEPNYLELFAAWLRRLGEDAEQLASILPDAAVPEPARQAIAGAVNYLFKSLDLIPDGIDDIGYLDDAFVLRVSAELALQDDMAELAPEKLAALNQLASDVDVVREFLGKDFTRLLDYVKGLRKGAARGRAVNDVVRDADVQSAFLQDVRGFVRSYESPSFSREEKTLVKLRAFFDAKLPK
jgi:uncharacterized membrane protein YkvA (DUF1232 family)